MQNLIVILIFLAAVGYLGWRAWVSLRHPEQGGCAKGCGCGDTEETIVASKTLPWKENIGA